MAPISSVRASMTKQRVLTGITTTGTPHLGNYVGASRPAIAASTQPDVESFLFLADYHALIKSQDPQLVRRSSKEVAATWLALGLDTQRTVFYRQSDIPEIPKLTWLLTCISAKGLLNRAHAYKAAVQANEDDPDRDPDQGINMGLFSYPILMAADILMFKADFVPVGRDQAQHIEMTREIAARFNHVFGEHLVLPQAVIEETQAVLPGLDGRKMSKSYNNTIPLWEPEKKLRKAIMKIKTNSLEPGEPKDPDDSALFKIYRAFVDAEAAAEMRQAFADGIAWGEAKQKVFLRINDELEEARERYNSYIERPSDIEDILQAGAVRARAFSEPFMHELCEATGISSLG